MIRRIFLAHPRTVGEGYWEHFGVASHFGIEMLIGGSKALVHAVFPNLCQTSASDTIRKLHKIMVEKRGAKRDLAEMLAIEWVI
ncbi:hypothetical protein D3Y57_10460 [Sphingomonas paeninsulae]|jgi:hypothetical protein|uniref:Uncharacterized protein n=1 Tax=Sphingomonas paeninsulae TaxID=2319844 RepID=A0A494TLL1_SPHPE|nr:DUF6356 family protein [Sphingomonas paeninsulae]AYJ86308.1 hypothetical protein D3Y57_10460 [Sphingomonas paeninsulae]